MFATLVVIVSVIARKLTPSYLKKAIMTRERTFIAVKVDGIQRGLVGEIIKRFEAKGFKLAGMKMSKPSEQHWRDHYADLSKLPFFPSLVKYMASGPVVAMCWEGTGVVKTSRLMMGETKPADSKPGTIRGDLCIEVGRNIIHGSDSVQSAEKELAMWFNKDELIDWNQAANDYIYEYLDRFSVESQSGLLKINEYLQGNSYIHGYSLSDADYILHKRIHSSFNKTQLPYLFRWYIHIKSFLSRESGICTEENEVPKNKVIKENKNPAPTVSNTIRGCNVFAKKENIYSELDPVTKPIIRSLYAAMLEVRAKEDVDANILEHLIRDVKMKGLKWGASKITNCPHEIAKISVMCTFDEEHISIHDVLIKLCKYENYVSDVDIGSFYKI